MVKNATRTVVQKLVAFVLLVGVIASMSVVTHAINIPRMIHMPSATRTITANGMTYNTRIYITCFGAGDNLYATTFIGTSCRTLVEAGTLTAQAAIFDDTGRVRASSETYVNSSGSWGMNVTTSPIAPNHQGQRLFHAIGDVNIRDTTTTRWLGGWRTPTAGNISRTAQAIIAESNMQMFMHNLHNVCATNGMVEVVGINNIVGLAFAHEIRNDSVAGYINVYAGYCMTIVDRFPILSVVVEYLN